MPTKVKICGLTEDCDVEQAVLAGADWIGLICHAQSPRRVSLPTARRLSGLVRSGVALANATKLVALVVNPDQAALTRVIETVRPDVVQFHGRESDALLLLACQHGVEVWRALPISSAEDVRAAQRQTVPDRLLFDARPPAGADRAGGWGHSFDWGLLAGANFAQPWLLAGGLTPLTVAQAVRQTGALAVDVSSGVERAPGRKCPHLMRTFIAEARVASP